MLNFIIIISGLLQNPLTKTVTEPSYLFLMTGTVDIILCIAGIMFAIVRKWSQDNNKFEVRVHDAKVLTIAEFKFKHGVKPKMHKRAKWSNKVWWSEHDQKVLPAVILPLVLIIILPYGWSEYIAPNFDMLNGTLYSPIVSGVLGMSGFLLMKIINKKETEYLD